MTESPRSNETDNNNDYHEIPESRQEPDRKQKSGANPDVTQHTNTAWHGVSSNTNTVEVLTEVYNNALMAKEGNEALIKSIDDLDLAEICRAQIVKYDEFCRRAQTLANQYACTLPEKNKGARMMAKMNIKLKMASDNSAGAIAEMLILGTTNGVIELGRLIRHTADIDTKAETLVKELIAYEEDKIDLMKFYL